MKTLQLPEKFAWVSLEDETYAKTLDLILNTNQNLNIIGNAGSGKSTLLKLTAELLSQNHRNVALLSPTGIAAVNISSEGIPATTIHSFFKIKPQDIYPKENLETHGFLSKTISNVDVFIFDEASMISCDLFDYVLESINSYTNGKLPRFILFSDILQLPPIIKNDYAIKQYMTERYNRKSFFFNSNWWKVLGFKTILLEKIYRQAEDSFKNILNRIRLGMQTNEDLAILNDHLYNKHAFEKLHPIYMNIGTVNAKVNQINEDYIRSYGKKGTDKLFCARINGKFDAHINSPLLERIVLKEDIQVMCLKNNYEFGYQNGSIGKIVSIDGNSVYVKLDNGKTVSVQKEKWIQYEYGFDNGIFKAKEKGTFLQIGCKPSAALSVWKSQGQTFNSIYFDIGTFNPEAVVYVALSRLTSIDGLGLEQKLTHQHIKTSREALEFLETV
jgi:ATP-dependent exoDNAse (exonuclease V) alpha subunit